MASRRPLKILLAFAIFGVCVAALASGDVVPESKDSLINAKLVIIRAPASGYVYVGNRNFGDVVNQGDILARVSSVYASPTKQQSDSATRDATQETFALEDQITLLEKLETEKRQEADAYRKGRIRDLESKLEEAETAKLLSIEREKQARAKAERQAELYRRGFVSRAAMEIATSAQKSAALERKMVETQMAARLFEISAARNGTFVADGFNDSPYSKQRADDLQIRLAELKTGSARDDQGGSLRSTPRGLLTRSPVIGKIWRMSASDGAYARPGDELMQIADCSFLFASADVDARTFEAAEPGQHALFLGADGSRMEGSILLKMDSDKSFESIIGSALYTYHRMTFPKTVVISVKPKSASACPVNLRGQVVLDENSSLMSRLVRAVGLH